MHDFEQDFNNEGFQFVIGIDEAGRGPLAGPVVAAAVFLKSPTFNSKITDSKKIPHRKRQIAFEEICQNALFGIGIINEGVIDRINILQATYLAMYNAVLQLMRQLPEAADCPEKVLLVVDGNSFKSDLPYKARPMVNGDSLCLSIAAASIIAKVTRDRILESYDKLYPLYGFSQHKGYPTQAHKLAIKNHGLSSIHRKTFNFV